MFVDSKIDMEETFSSLSPTAIKIVEKLQQSEKIAQMVTEARQGLFLPF